MHNQNYLCLHYFLCFCCLSAESQITPYNTSSDGLRMQNTKRFKRTDRTRELLDMFIKPREHTNLNKTKKEMLNEGKDRIRHFDVEEMKKSLAKNEIFETVNANILRQQKGVKAVCGGSKNVFQFDDLIAYQSVRFKQLRTSKHNIKEFKACFSFGGEITVNKLGVYIPTPYIMVSAYLHFDIHNYPDFWVLMESYLGVQTFRENWAINDYKCKNNGSFEEEIDYDKGKCWFNFSCQSEGMKSKLHIVTFGVAGNFSLKKGSASDAPLPTYEYITDSTFVYEQHNYTPPTLDKQYWNLTPKWTTTVTTTTQSEAEKEDEEQKKKVNKAATVVGVIVAVVAIVLVLRVAFIFAALWWW